MSDMPERERRRIKVRARSRGASDMAHLDDGLEHIRYWIAIAIARCLRLDVMIETQIKPGA